MTNQREFREALDAARHAIDALNARDWREFARCVHDDDLTGWMSTREDSGELPPYDALADFIEKQDAVQEIQEHISSVMLSSGQAQQAAANIPRPIRSVIGEVKETSDLSHIVYRLSWGGDDPGELHVCSMERSPAGWKLKIEGELFDHDNVVFAVGDRPQDE